VLISKSDDAKIADFGLARETTQDESHFTQSATGPLRWLAPESIRERRHNESSDAWMYSCLIFEVLACAKPYPEVLEAVLAAADVARGTLRPTLDKTVREGADPRVLAVFDRCTEFEPANRMAFAAICKLFDDDESDASATNAVATHIDNDAEPDYGGVAAVAPPDSDAA
jgi:fibroblast growth factor receptor 2